MPGSTTSALFLGGMHAALIAAVPVIEHDRIGALVFAVNPKHARSVDDFGPYSRIQATTVDPGSKWFTDMVGNYARPGTTRFTVQQGRPGAWDDLKVV